MRTWMVDEEDERILLDGVPVLEIGDYCESAEDNLPLLRFIVDACNRWTEELNETVCPLCGKDFHRMNMVGAAVFDPHRAQAHYLAHLAMTAAQRATTHHQNSSSTTTAC